MLGVRAAEEEARIAKTLDTRFSGSRVEQRMKMQEKQEVRRLFVSVVLRVLFVFSNITRVKTIGVDR